MQEVINYIKEKKLIKEGQTVGVAVSGAADSMALLYILNQMAQSENFKVIAIHINHMLRDTAKDDAQLVTQFCSLNNIKLHIFNVDAAAISKQEKISLEMGARKARYGVFDALLQKKIVDKIAIAHHKNDQAETILLNLFRGTGTRGIRGMEVQSGEYIRPLLNTSKEEIVKFVKEKELPFAIDETNADNVFQRNFIRNQLLPEILSVWPNALNSLLNFCADCVLDNEFIESQITADGVICAENTAKIPTSYFLSHKSIIARIIFKSLREIGVMKDIERKHILLISELAITGKIGSKLNLPYKLIVIKEYDYIVLINKEKPIKSLDILFKAGSFSCESADFKVKKIKNKQNFIKSENTLLIDADKLPEGCSWRFKKEGDYITKFGGGTKKLKSFLVDKKVPSRKRSILPLLARDSEIFVILGLEISENVKIDQNTKSIYKITLLKDKIK